MARFLPVTLVNSWGSLAQVGSTRGRGWLSGALNATIRLPGGGLTTQPRLWVARRSRELRGLAVLRWIPAVRR